MRKKNILVINAGSSSDKISFYVLPEQGVSFIPAQAAQWQKEIDFPSGDIESIDWVKLLNSALQSLLQEQKSTHSNNPLKTIDDIDIIGHRVVHGGEKYSSAVLIDEQVKKDIKHFIPLAPLHNKIALLHIDTLQKLLPNAKQVAVFDTAFHQTLPDIVSFYPLPYQWREQYGIRRFGFHGINHQYCYQEAANLLKQLTENFSAITCHLGSGCSLAAIENGKSVNTTMGFTPLEGLMMATRSGSIDPSILLFLLKDKKMNIEDLERTLNKNSGLLGISQSTADMKTIIQKMQEDDKARLAFQMFVHHLCSGIASMRASLSKLDAIVFTGGIGAHSSLVRQKACSALNFLDMSLDENANQQSESKISTANSKTAVLVIKAAEDWSIAQQCLGCVSVEGQKVKAG